MSNRIDKPKKTADELVSMLQKEKGITFDHISADEAADYLRDRNNYLRTASYRKNYDKHKDGDNEGKYIKLDFAYLVELSRIDMHLRRYLLQMCIDVEHALKVRLIADLETNTAEDGYTIVENFLKQNPDIQNSIAGKAGSVFTGDLISKYFGLNPTHISKDGNVYTRTEIVSIDCPAWVLVEILAFKDLLRFIEFYCITYPNRICIQKKLLNPVRNLRNACAHNNCILLSLRPGSTHPTRDVSYYVSKIPSIAKEERKNKLTCRPLYEIVCLLMQYNTWVSESLRKKRMAELKEFAHGRLVEHIDYFKENQIVTTAIFFLQKIVDNFA